MEEGGGLLGRCFIDPRECLSTEQDPTWRVCHEPYTREPKDSNQNIHLAARLFFMHAQSSFESVSIMFCIEFKRRPPAGAFQGQPGAGRGQAAGVTAGSNVPDQF